MRNILTAGLTALSLILIPAAPVQAQSDNDALNRAILGLLAAGAIGLAIKNSSDGKATLTHRNPSDRQPAHRAHDRQNRDQRQQNAGRSRAVDPIPGRCFRRVETARGGYRGVFLNRCLERRYRDVKTLPRRCAVRVGGPDGRARGFDAACLRDFGYRSDRRWN